MRLRWVISAISAAVRRSGAMAWGLVAATSVKGAKSAPMVLA